MRANIMKPQRLVCHCGTIHFRNARYRYGECCSRACYLASKRLDVPQVQRMARMELTITAAAATIGMNRHTFSSRLKKQGLVHLFKRGIS